jgi:predicted ATPase
VVLYGHRRELQVMQQQAEMLLALATAQGFPAFVAVGTILRGVALAEQGHRETGITQAHRGLAALRAARAELPRPFFLILLAETCGRIGEIEEGLKLLDEVLAIVGKTGAHVHEAELYRLKGELLLSWEVKSPKPVLRFVEGAKLKSQNSENPNPLSQLPTSASEAEECFLKAIDLARKQKARSFELRATISLVQLRQQQAIGQKEGSTEHRTTPREARARSSEQRVYTKLAEAHRMLSEVYNWFTEGFDTKDLQEAKALLEELKH